MRGATLGYLDALDHIIVSIHAPREGCDPQQAKVLKSEIMFQFTHPVRGATYSYRYKQFRDKFQFTHPVRGATTRVRPGTSSTARFNSRTP